MNFGDASEIEEAEDFAEWSRNWPSVLSGRWREGFAGEGVSVRFVGGAEGAKSAARRGSARRDSSALESWTGGDGSGRGERFHGGFVLYWIRGR